MISFRLLRFVIAATTLLEASILDGAEAIRFLSKSDDISMSKHHQGDEPRSDLTAFVRASLIDKPHAYVQALSLLDSMQNAPSCNRLAASTLLDSCQSIEGSTAGGESFIEDIRSVYAVKLAVCEIVSAGSTVPSHCIPFRSASAESRQRGRGGAGANGRGKPPANDIESRHLSQCLQSLESRPQWWTSYSNSRQNAVVMCQAVRADIEKDDLIRLHKSMTQVDSDIHSALSKALQEANERLSQQAEFATAVQKYQEQVLRDLDESHVEAQSLLAKVLKSLETVTQSVMSRLSTAVDKVETEVVGLNENIRKSNVEAMDLQENVGRVFQKVVEGSSELAASQVRQWQQSEELAATLQRSLGSMRDTEVQALLGAFGSINGHLQQSNELVSLMYLRQNDLDQRLVNLDKSFTGLGDKAEAFHAAQNRQAESQTRLYDQMQTEMYVARGLLADVTSSAATLQAALEDTSSKVANLVTSGALTTTVLRWGWLSLVLFILYLLNPRYAGFAAAAWITLLLLAASGVPSPFAALPNDIVLIHYASGFQVPLVPAMKILFLLTLPLLATLIYITSARFRAFCSHILNAASGPALKKYRSFHNPSACNP